MTLNLVSNTKRNESDSERLDRRRFSVHVFYFSSRCSVGDEESDANATCSAALSSVHRVEHLRPRDPQPVGHVRVLVEVIDTIDGCQKVRFVRKVLQRELEVAKVACGSISSEKLNYIN